YIYVAFVKVLCFWDKKLFEDKKADLIINTFVDDVLEKVCKRLGLEIPEYNPELDPTKNQCTDAIIEWNIYKDELRSARKQYEKLNREYRKKKAEEKILLSTFKKAKVLLKKEVLTVTRKEEKPDEELTAENKEVIVE
ncbi:unnamed protein product, partial [Callosobruchus maculatus]